VRSSVQKPRGSTMRNGASLPRIRRSWSPVTRRSAFPSMALAKTQRSSGSLTMTLDGAEGLGTTSYSRRNCSIASIVAAGSLSFTRSTLRSSRRTTSPTRSTCSARTWRRTSAHRPRVAKALTRTFVSRNTLKKCLGRYPRPSGTLWPLRTAELDVVTARIGTGLTADAGLHGQSRCACDQSAQRGGPGAGSGQGPGEL